MTVLDEVTRRDFVKITAAAAGVVAVASNISGVGLGLFKEVPAKADISSPEQRFVTCTDNGVRYTYVRDGRVIRSEPIPIPANAAYPKFNQGGKVFSPPFKTHVGPVAIGYRKYTYATSRIRYPMKRVDFVPGGKGPVDGRGKNQWVRLSWDDAMSLVASEYKRILATYGASAVEQYNGSNSETTTFEGQGNYGRLINIMGGFTDCGEPTYSECGWAAGGPLIHGYNWNKGAPDKVDNVVDVIRNSQLIIFWATNPIITSISSDGTYAANLYYYLKSLGKRVIVVGPRYNDTMAHAGDTFIGIIPGTDAAMMAAIAYTWIKEGTYDKTYVATHTVGFDESSLPTGAPSNRSFTAYITGAMDGVPKTPEWAEAITGVKARVIRALAREWASKPTQLAAGHAGANRASYGWEWTRFCVALLAMQGYGRPGSNYWDYCSGWPSTSGASKPSASFDSAPNTAYANPITQTLPRQSLTDAQAAGSWTWWGDDPAGAKENLFRTYTWPAKGYSIFHMVFATAHSHFNSRVNVNKTAKAYMNPAMEFVVTFSPWWGGGTTYSDIVLPVATLLEQDDFGSNGTIHKLVCYHGQCIPPMYESKSDSDAAIALATALGVADKFTGGQTKAQIMEAAFNKSNLAKTMTYAQFKATGWVYASTTYSDSYTPAPNMAWFYSKAINTPADGLVGTISGKVEFYSELVLQQVGANDGRVNPVPMYRPRREGRYNTALAAKYPLELLTSHRLFRFHAQHDTIMSLRNCYKVTGPDGVQHEPIYMSPVDAAARGLKDGDIAKAFNDRGAVLVGVRVTKTQHPGVVQIHESSWFDPVDGTNPAALERSGCANALTNSDGQGDTTFPYPYGRCMPDVSALVEVQKWSGS